MRDEQSKPYQHKTYRKRIIVAVIVSSLLTASLTLVVSHYAYNQALNNPRTRGRARNPGTIHGPEDLDGYSYIVYKGGSTYYARNGTTRAIDYSGTNASQTIQSAIDALGTNGGKIFIKAGTYDISSSLTLCSNLLITGEGESTVLKLADNADTNIINDQTDIKENVVFRDLVFDGNKDNQTNPSNREDRACVVMRQISNVVFDCVTIKNARTGAGLIFGGNDDGTNASNLWISNCHFFDNGYVGGTGNNIADDAWIGYVTNLTITNTYFGACTDVGLSPEMNRDAIISNCTFKTGSTSHGAVAFAHRTDSYDNLYNMLITSVIIEMDGASYPAIWSTRYAGSKFSDQVIISNSFIRNVASSEALIQLANVHNVKIFGNYLGYAQEIIEVLDDIDRLEVTENNLHNASIGLLFNGTAQNRIAIKDNCFVAVTTPLSFVTTPTNLIIRQNEGYVTENSRSATSVSNGDWQAHGLAGTPTTVVLAPPSKVNVRCNARNATHFQLGVATGTADIDRRSVHHDEETFISQAPTHCFAS